MDTISSRKEGDKMIVFCGSISVEFDTRYGEKQYPFICNLNNIKLSDELISKIESSNIVKVDTDLSSYSQNSGHSTLYLIPKFGYSLDRIMLVFYNLLQNLSNGTESEN